MSLLVALQQKKTNLQHAETKVRHVVEVFGSEVQITGPENQVVLILSKYLNGYHDWIQKKAVKVLFTTPYTKSVMNPKDQKHYAHIETFDDYDTTGLIEYMAVKLHKQFAFTHVVALIEEDIIRAARIREALKIKVGQSLASAMRFRDKVIMKQVLAEKGIKVPKFSPVDSATDLAIFLQQHSYPVVVKPRKGYSSINTAVLRSDEDLERFLKKSFGNGIVDPSLDLEVEVFIQGQMYHIDGIVYNNEIKLISPSKYLGVVVNFGNNPLLAGCALSLDNPLTRRLQQFIADCVTALEGPSCFAFHAEAWHTPEDEIVLCEVACRTGGGEIGLQMMEMYEYNFDKTVTQAQCENTVTNKKIDELWTTRRPVVDFLASWSWAYPPNKAVVVESLPEECELDFVMWYKKLVKPGHEFISRTACSEAAASFVCNGQTEAQLEDNTRAAVNWFNEHVKYRDV